MPQSLQQQTHKQAEEVKSCIKVKNGKKIERNRHNVFYSQTKPENQNCQNFVKLNRRKAFDKLGGRMLHNIEKLRNRGFFFKYYCFVCYMELIIK